MLLQNEVAIVLPQVIVIPIFWNKRVHEKEEVLEAARRACDLLTDAGIAAGCDTTVEMSPGQKFKHWCGCEGLTQGIRITAVRTVWWQLQAGS